MPEAPGTLILSNITVVDTETGKLTQDATVTLAEGRITSIAAGSPAPAETTVIDARGKFLVPGFLDMHVHSMQDPHPADSLNMLLAYGVTGIRQMAGAPELLERRRLGQLDFGPDTPACLAMPGTLLTFGNCPSPEAAVNEVRRQKEQGADFIKSIILSPKAFFASAAEANHLGLGYGGHVSPGVDIIKASKSGLTFVEHLGPIDFQLIQCSRMQLIINLMMRIKPPAPPPLTPSDIQGTVGRTLIANPTFFRLKMDPQSLRRTEKLIASFVPRKAQKLAEACAENGTWQCPTLIRNETMQFGDDPRFTESPDLRFVPQSERMFWTGVAQQYSALLTPADRDTLKRLKELSARLVKIFEENGTPMMAGSDYGGGWVIPGVSLHQEFDLLAEAGMSPLRVLQMTTLDGAKFLKREATMGTVAVGKEANLVLLNSNPIDSVQNLHGIHAVIRDGRYLSADALHQMKERVAERVATA